MNVIAKNILRVIDEQTLDSLEVVAKVSTDTGKLILIRAEDQNPVMLAVSRCRNGDGYRIQPMDTETELSHYMGRVGVHPQALNTELKSFQ